jgi:hypothetical protein
MGRQREKNDYKTVKYEGWQRKEGLRYRFKRKKGDGEIVLT